MATRATRLLRRRRLECWALDLNDRLRNLRERPPVEGDTAKDLEDDAADSRTRQLEYALAQMRSDSLRDIGEALRRLEGGGYGICAECAAPISEARLRALPSAVLCHRCQSLREVAPAERITARPQRTVPDPRGLVADEPDDEARAARRAQALMDSAA